MSVSLIVNGVSFAYPEPLDEDWGQSATDWAAAVTSGMLQKAGGTFTLTAEVDFGAGFGLKSLYYKSRTTNPAAAGQIRLARTDTLSWRNEANDADLALSVNASNQLLFDGNVVGNIDTVTDTNSIDLTLTAGDLTADLKLSAASPDAGFINASLSIEPDGLQAQVPILVGDSGAGGTSGTVPAPGIGDGAKFLRGDGTWQPSSSPLIFNDTATINLTDTAGTITADIVNDSITNVMINSAAAIAFSKMAALTASRALVSGGSGVVSVATTTATEIGYVNGVTSAIQTQLDSKAPSANPTFTGTVTVPLTASRAVITGASSELAASATTATEIGYVNGVRSAIQTQIDAQAANNARNLNWITNYGIEVNTTGYATYADAAQSTPVDGTGGSPNVTISRNTSSPLDGVADLSFVKDAANRQGQGFSYDFTIDSAYQGTVQQIAFNYKVVSGTYSSGDLTCWVYDVSNAVLLTQPSGNSIISTSIPSQQGQCTFQTNINSTSYRLIFHVTSTSASAYTLAFDNISVGPQIGSNGSVNTAYTAYTPTTNGMGTIVTDYARWRRIGDSIEVQVKLTMGTTTGVQAQLGIPFVIASGYTDVVVNTATVNTSDSYNITIIANSGNSYFQFGWQRSAGSASFTPQNANTIFPNSTAISFTAVVRIAGWEANNVLSTSGNTRLVDFLAYKNGGSVTGGSAIGSWTTVTKDSVSGFNTTTGVYTVQVPGDYFVNFQAAFTTSNADFLAILKNGSAVANGVDATTSIRQVSVLMPNCVVGDTISVTNSGSRTVSSSSVQTNLSIFLLQGPQQIAASEVIAFEANTSNTAATTSAPFIYTNKVSDTHNAYSTSTGIFTTPAPGYYQINGQSGSTTAHAITLYVNGSSYLIGVTSVSTSTSFVSVVKYLPQGTTLQLRPSTSATADGSSSRNSFSVFRISGIV